MKPVKLRVMSLVATAGAALGVCEMAMAVGGNTAANVNGAQDAEFWYVGRTQYEITAVGNHVGSGSYIRQGVAMTAGHVINGDSSTGQRFERFQLGGTQYLALGVQHPSYDPTVAVDIHDIGILLTLNGRDRAGAEAFPTLAAAGVGDQLAVGDTIQLLGFATPGGGSNKRIGGMELTARAANVYTYGRPPSQDFSMRGDSGGPHVRDFGDARGKRIVAVVRSGDGNAAGTAGTVSHGTRVDSHRDFLDGDGNGGSRAIVRLTGVNAGNWSTAARWARGSGAAAQVPRAADVVVLDPTDAANAATVITLDVNSANLDGLLNDVTLQIPNARLRVENTGTNTPGSGVLNGGEIVVGGGGAGDAGVMDVGWATENAGKLTINRRGTVTLGTAVAAGARTIVLRNSVFNGVRGNVTVEGQADVPRADLDVRNVAENYGDINVKANGRARFGTSFPAGAGSNFTALTNEAGGKITVDGANALLENTAITDNKAEVNVKGGGMANFGRNLPLSVGGGNNPIAFDNLAMSTLNVGANGTMNVRNGVRESATLVNRRHATVNIEGGAAGNGVLNVDNASNYGNWNAKSGARMTVTTETYNRGGGVLTVEGGANGTAVVRAGAITNFTTAGMLAGGRIDIKKGGRVEASRSAGLGAGNALTNAADATIDIRAGGQMRVTGNSVNRGTIKVSSTNADGFGLFENTSPGAAASTFENRSLITMDTAGGATKAAFGVDNTTFTNFDAKIEGSGQFIITSNSNWQNQRVAQAGDNYNSLDFLWDAGRGAGNANVSFEIMSVDNSNVPAGLTQRMAVNRICIMNSSRVALADASANEGVAGMEVLYTRYLGIDGGSRLDLAGRTLYYLDPDPMCPLTMTSIVLNGGRLIRIPEPGVLALVGLGGLVAARRRRGC